MKKKIECLLKRNGNSSQEIEKLCKKIAKEESLNYKDPKKEILKKALFKRKE